jgi:hypothetical protein
MHTIKVAQGHAGSGVEKVGKTVVFVDFHGVCFRKTLTKHGGLRGFASLGEVC